MMRKKASLFAAELLMPETFLRQDLAGRSALDLYDEEYIPELAQKYGVSVQALMFRLQYIGYIENLRPVWDSRPAGTLSVRFRGAMPGQ